MINRIVSTAAMAACCAVIPSFVFVVHTKITDLVAFMLELGSPIIYLRLWQCKNDPIWAAACEAIAPFMLIGALIGFLANQRPVRTLGYATLSVGGFALTAFAELIWQLLVVNSTLPC